MLVKAGIEEYPVLANRPSQSTAELLLAIVGLAGGIRLLSVKGAVAKVIERGAVPLVAARLGHYVEYGAASPAEFGAVGVRRYAELLQRRTRQGWRRRIQRSDQVWQQRVARHLVLLPSRRRL